MRDLQKGIKYTENKALLFSEKLKRLGERNERV